VSIQSTAESMRNSTRFGFCGLSACMCSFYLSLATGLSQEPKIPVLENSPVGEDLSQSRAAAAALRELQEQNLAVLQAIEQLQEDRDAALQRYSAGVSTQLNTLTEAFLSQRSHELQTVRNSNRFILTVTASIAGFAVLIMVLSAFVPVWAIKHFAAIRHEPPLGGFWLQDYGSAWSLPPAEPSGGKLGGAIEHLEHRLQALEERAVKRSEEIKAPTEQIEKAPTAKIASAKSEPLGGKFSRARSGNQIGGGRSNQLFAARCDRGQVAFVARVFSEVEESIWDAVFSPDSRR